MIAETRETIYPADRYMPPHRDGSSKLGLVLSGVFHEETRGQEQLVHTGDVLIKSGSHWHATRIGRHPVRVFSIGIDQSLAEQVGGYALRRDDWGGFKRLLDLYTAWKTCQPMAFKEKYAQMQGFFSQRTIPPQPVPEWLQKIKAQLQEPEPVQVKELAEQAGCHPVHLARCFRAAFQCSMSEFRRLARLKSLLRTLPYERNLAQVAIGTGFYDQSHMNRAFRNQFFVSPGAWRKSSEG